MVIKNGTFGLSDEIILLSESLVCSPLIKKFEDLQSLKNLQIDTSTTFNVVDHFNNQRNVLVLDRNIISALDFSSLNYLKIEISNAIKVTRNLNSGFLVYFSTEFLDKNQFAWDSDGIVIGWLDNFGFFERFEFIEKNFPVYHNIKLIEAK